MSEKEKLLEVISFLDKLQQCTLDAYEEIKYVLLSVTRDRTDLFELVQELCNLAEDSRPRLLEMKR